MCFFFFNDTATTEIYTLSLHDALPISRADSVPTSLVMPLSCRVELHLRIGQWDVAAAQGHEVANLSEEVAQSALDRKSTRLNSSHANISYAVFCLKKKITIAVALVSLL